MAGQATPISFKLRTRLDCLSEQAPVTRFLKSLGTQAKRQSISRLTLTVGKPVSSPTPVMDVRYDRVDDVLVAGTLGRGAWIINNASQTIGNQAPKITLPMFGSYKRLLPMVTSEQASMPNIALT